MSQLPVYINGKFYAGGLNGVYRVSDRLIQEIDSQINQNWSPPITLLLPSRHQDEKKFTFRNIKVQKLDETPSQTWEQWHLPRHAADGVLLNLANLAPIRHRRKITLIHDAQFLFPDNSYPLRQRLGYRLLMPRMAQSSATVLTVSDYSRRMLDIMGVSQPDCTKVLYNGVDHILDAPADVSILAQYGLNHRAYALMFGSPKSYKNNAVVFNAYAQDVLQDIPLVLVGTNRNALSLQGIIAPPSTIFIDKCNDFQLRALYENARCLLCPSRTEGFGLPPLESMLCGTPVVIAPAGALPEVCRDAALYADVDDPQSWVDAINQLDPASPLFQQKVDHGRTRAEQFTWARAGQELIRTIRKLSDNP